MELCRACIEPLQSDKEFAEAGSCSAATCQRMVVRLMVHDACLSAVKSLRQEAFGLRQRDRALWDWVARSRRLRNRCPRRNGGERNVSISSTSPTSLTISQSSRTGIVNWSSFSIGQGNQVQFNNGSGATLNRVTGNVPSSINGVVSATGSVYLVNPSGVVVGPGGEIKTGGSFVASTLDVKDAEFRAGGSLTFSGNSNASVVNLGKIGASKGDVVLIARQVRNDGSLTARNGTAAMASGSEVVLSDGSLGNGKVSVRRPAQDGEIRNSGRNPAPRSRTARQWRQHLCACRQHRRRPSPQQVSPARAGEFSSPAEGGSVNVTQKVRSAACSGGRCARAACRASPGGARSPAETSSSAATRSWSAARSRRRVTAAPAALSW
jgi:filamentous hemagglutinin family protein